MLFEWIRHQPAILLLLVFMAADILTGIGAAIVTKSVSSDISMKGMVRKAIVLIIIGLTACIDRLQGEVPIMKLVAFSFCAMEAISIAENCGRAGVPLPQPLRDVLAKLNPSPTSSPAISVVTATASVVTTTPDHDPAVVMASTTTPP